MNFFDFSGLECVDFLQNHFLVQAFFVEVHFEDSEDYNVLLNFFESKEVSCDHQVSDFLVWLEIRELIQSFQQVFVFFLVVPLILREAFFLSTRSIDQKHCYLP